VKGYESHTYGDAFADVYDDWYQDLSDVDALVALIAEFAPGEKLCELGIGTGRLAIPLANNGFTVTGIDSSDAMLARLRVANQQHNITVVAGDMVDDMPKGPFDVVLIGFNTLFNLESQERQQQCLTTCAHALRAGGIVVVEGLIPTGQPDGGTVDDVSLKSMTATNVVLSVSRHLSAEQLVEGQFIEFTEQHGIRLRPWSIRYSTTDQLDRMATAAGLAMSARFHDANRTPFDPASGRHLTLYTLDK
jgi:2-polyprenyl-3-methyl-5-hydroxy-6-metoxy-1,4-benzoquinol methylase